MLRGLGFFLFVFIFTCTAKADENPYQLKDLQCSETAACWEQIENQARDFENFASQKKIATQIKTWHHKTPYVFVFVHGLFDSGTIFNSFRDEFFSNGNNVVNLILPGHGADSSNGFKLQAVKWFEEMKRATRFASHLGEKTVFITHSMGSALSLYEILEKEKIDTLVMVEPALQPRPSIVALACAAQHVIPDARFFLPLLRFFLNMVAMDRPIPVHMGCEVKKIRETLFNKYVGEAGDYPEDRPGFDDVVIENYKILAAKVKTPLLIINNENDGVVDVTVNHEFYKASDSSLTTYVSLDNFREPHGTYLVRYKNEFRKVLEEFLNRLSSR